MLSSLIRFSIYNRNIVIAASLLMMLYGAYQISNAGLDIFPEFSPKLVVIQTEAPGYSAEQVEVLVTQIIENALMGMIGVETIRSESIQGLSVVNVFFEDATDVYRNRQLVSERLAGISSALPVGVETPVPAPMASSSATVMTIGVTSEKHDLMKLRTIVDTSLVPRLLSTDGVADVNVFGGEVRQLQIHLKPDLMEQYSISVDEIVNASRRAGNLYGAGFIENSNQRLTLHFVEENISPEKLEQVVLKQSSSNTIFLGDVTDITVGLEPPFGAAAIMQEPAVVMMVIAQYGANTLTVTQNVEVILKQIKVLLDEQDVTLHADLFRPANYIETSLHNLAGHLLIGGVFVVIIIFLFLFNARTALISVLAIPMSLIGATMVLLQMGVNLNIMILGGLAIALGEVVDDAIIDTENIFRRLRQNKALEAPLPLSKVVYDASVEVRGSVVYATFIVAVTFIPLLTLSGVAGRLFSPLGFSYILAILMSLLVALTLTPALSYALLASDKLSHRDPPAIRLIQPLYAAILNATCKMPLLTLTISVLFCLLGVSYITSMGGSFLPNLREGHYIVHTTMQPGTSLQESIRTGNLITEKLLQVDGVQSVSQWAGRAQRSADTYGSHYSEFEVDLKSMTGSEQQAVLDEIREILSEFPGLLFEAHNFLSERIFETISGYTSPVVVNLYGNDLSTLDAKAQEVASVMRGIEGAVAVQVRAISGTPNLDIQLDVDKMGYFGVRPRDVIELVQVAYQGAEVGVFQEGNHLYDIAVILDASRHDLHSLATLPLKTLTGRMIELQDVAQIKQTSGRYNILHQNAQRLQTITCYVSGRDVVSFMQELEDAITTGIHFDAVTIPEFTGAAIEQARARNELVIHSLLVGAVILMFIYMAIGSVRHMLLMLLNLPFSLVGGVFAVILTGATVSVGSLVGFVTLFGITVRNSIMLISHYQHLVESENMQWNQETVIQGALERLPSILMTALVTALAMLPIAVDSDNAGREIMGPMAAIIIGGLASSTILNLLIMPSIMFKFARFR